MRYAPKFLDPWQRIDRMVDDLAEEWRAESKRMVADAYKAVDAIIPVRKTTHSELVSVAAYSAFAMRR